MKNTVSREDVLKAIKNVEHPEISATLLDLGMILDVAVDGKAARVAMALPTMEIPEAVRGLLVESIRKPVLNMGLSLDVEFFEMSRQDRNRFLATARAQWKDSV